MDKKDYVAQVMDEWYLAMASNNVAVQPKASTLLGMLLANYDIKPKQEPRNIWDEFLTIPGGCVASWFDSLTEDQKIEFDKQRQENRCSHDQSIDTKSLLKG